MDPLEALRGAVGAQQVLAGADAEPYALDWRERYRWRSLAVVRPDSAEQVAAVVRLCAEAGVPWYRRAAIPAFAAGRRRMTRAGAATGPGASASSDSGFLWCSRRVRSRRGSRRVHVERDELHPRGQPR